MVTREGQVFGANRTGIGTGFRPASGHGPQGVPGRHVCVGELQQSLFVIGPVGGSPFVWEGPSFLNPQTLSVLRTWFLRAVGEEVTGNSQIQKVSVDGEMNLSGVPER